MTQLGKNKELIVEMADKGVTELSDISMNDIEPGLEKVKDVVQFVSDHAGDIEQGVEFLGNNSEQIVNAANGIYSLLGWKDEN